ncbi:MAG: hypothetical protein JWL70_92, partial [Acidimicrobiia bacterium]|nr:hypothetical protein [Acidimicrobiia bacterium]
MAEMVERVDRWLLRPAPPQRLASLRILVGGYAVIFLLVRLPGFLDVFDLPREQFAPVGPLAWMSSPVAPTLARVLLGVTVAAGVAFVAGWRWRLSGPLFALLFLMATTYRVSFGHVLHTDHLPALHLLVLGFSPAASAWSLDQRREGGPVLRNSERFGWPVRILALLTVITYMLAGVAKLRYGGFDWLTGDVLRNQIAYDNLRKVLIGDVHSPLGGWLVRHPLLLRPFATVSVVVELGALVALSSRRLGHRTVRGMWAGAAWGFHVGIAALMAIAFPYQLC